MNAEVHLEPHATPENKQPIRKIPKLNPKTSTRRFITIFINAFLTQTEVITFTFILSENLEQMEIKISNFQPLEVGMKGAMLAYLI
jgi:hypothetical protein